MTWVHSLRSQWLGMRAHEHTPLAEIRRFSEVPPQMPLFETVVVFDDTSLEELLPGATGDACGTAGRQFRLRGITNYPLVLSGFAGNCLRVELTYDRRRIEDEGSRPDVRAPVHLPLGMITNPHRALQACRFYLPKSGIGSFSSGTIRSGLCTSTIASPVCSRPRSSATPKATALIQGEVRLTYHELNQKANRLARSAPRRLKAVPDTPMVLCLERSPALVIAMLAITKAGAAVRPARPRLSQGSAAIHFAMTHAPAFC